MRRTLRCSSLLYTHNSAIDFLAACIFQLALVAIDFVINVRAHYEIGDLY